MTALGRHLLIELYKCDENSINDQEKVETAMVAAAQEAKATVISSSFHKFSPYGISGTVVIAESHLAIHTWPEYQYASLDIYTCGEDVDPWIAFEYLKKYFKPENISATEMKRGILDGVENLKHK